jgi:hypothetical protein
VQKIASITLLNFPGKPIDSNHVAEIRPGISKRT